MIRLSYARFLAVPLLLLDLSGCGGPTDQVPIRQVPAMQAPEIAKITGAYTHGNLQIWLVHGPDQHRSARQLVPLAAALEQGLAVVHETGDVNQLAIENLGTDIDVYVQSGDIVQGGKQDRTIGVDLVLAPKSGRVPLPSFCVEHGRWTPRGQGEVPLSQFHSGEAGIAPPVSFGGGTFTLASNNVATNAMKRALLVDADQQAVWKEVAITQAALSENLGETVNDASSPTSLELSLETKAVKDATADYLQALQSVVDGHADAIGFVVAIGGRLDSADVYGSHALFSALWPKLLRGSATAAVAGSKESGPATIPTTEQVRAFLCEPQGERQQRKIAGGVLMAVGETAASDVVDSHDDGGLLHRTWLAK